MTNRKTIIVEKAIIQNGTRRELCAVACPERNAHTVLWSLAFESHLTPWTDREAAEKLQAEIEAAKSALAKAGVEL